MKSRFRIDQTGAMAVSTALRTLPDGRQIRGGAKCDQDFASVPDIRGGICQSNAQLTEWNFTIQEWRRIVAKVTLAGYVSRSVDSLVLQYQQIIGPDFPLSAMLPYLFGLAYFAQTPVFKIPLFISKGPVEDFHESAIP
ncbi:MAG: hypothetical protein IPN71_13000 [Fibrobacteres bacterium]|nr:hypothetical protein [Fibrobacterota bacterium]